jgi:hypothetical protein
LENDYGIWASCERDTQSGANDVLRNVWSVATCVRMIESELLEWRIW